MTMKSDLKMIFAHFLDLFANMVISIEHIICRVITSDHWLVTGKELLRAFKLTIKAQGKKSGLPRGNVLSDSLCFRCLCSDLVIFLYLSIMISDNPFYRFFNVFLSHN